MKIPAVILWIALTAAFFTGCSPNAAKPAAFNKGKINSNVNEGNARFAFDIFKQINSEDRDKNVFISPFSISTALTMTYQGARGTTKEAMEKTLQFSGLSRDDINESYGNLLKYLKQADNKLQLDISNSIWIGKGKPVRENVVSANKKIFDAKVTSLDFSGNNAVDTINKWIKDSTKVKNHQNAGGADTGGRYHVSAQRHIFQRAMDGQV